MLCRFVDYSRAILAIGALVCLGGVARADSYSLTEQFQSGATFTGTVTFDAGGDTLTGVNGWLNGGGYGSEQIDQLWDSSNYASGYGPDLGGNYLLGADYWLGAGDLIAITWDFSNAPVLALTSPGGVLALQGGNSVDYGDPLVSGSFGPAIASAPDAADTAWLLAASLVLLGASRAFGRRSLAS
ncbi:MAG TPA: hypothetical protein VGL42_10185 [Opitutaceae bacterium]